MEAAAAAAAAVEVAAAEAVGAAVRMESDNSERVSYLIQYVYYLISQYIFWLR